MGNPVVIDSRTETYTIPIHYSVGILQKLRYFEKVTVTGAVIRCVFAKMRAKMITLFGGRGEEGGRNRKQNKPYAP